MKLSIIIAALNEEKYLPKLLKSIKSQRHQCEVIVADSCSEDNTVKVARKYGAKVVKARRGLPAYGRNAGAKAAKGDIILFLDADVILPPEFLKKNVEEFERKKLDAASCYIKPLSKKPFDWIIMYGISNVWLFLFQYFWPNAFGFCIFAKKKWHKRIKGFDETITFLEDAAYVNKAFQMGAKFRMLRGEKIYTSMRRFDDTGRLKAGLEYVRLHYKRIFSKEIRENVNYNFGNF